jgi:hypothetical protein
LLKKTDEPTRTLDVTYPDGYYVSIVDTLKNTSYLYWAWTAASE